MDFADLTKYMANLAPAHRDGIMWFFERTGTDIGWPDPSPVPALEHVVSQAKAIYSPAGTGVALSIRQNLKSPYSDRDPIFREDGTWLYAYHIEGSQFDDSYANRSLMQNMEKELPVAVIIQTKPKPNSVYRVLGIAMVTHYSDGFFFLEGFNSDGKVHASSTASRVLAGEDLESFLDLEIDARVKTMAVIAKRQGQAEFRAKLLELYESRCAISGTGVPAVLDAAHIVPYRGVHTNIAQNGMLLRTDLHSLFDQGLIAIDPENRNVMVSKSLIKSEYWGLNGMALREPVDSLSRPSSQLLKMHLDWSKILMH